MAEIKWSELEGRGVITADGREIGEISDVVINHESWSVEAVVLKLGRELLEVFHMKRPMFGTQTFQIPTSTVSSVGDKVLLNKKLEELTKERARAAAAVSEPDE